MTAVPVTTFRRFLTIPAGSTATNEGGSVHLTADLQIGKTVDGGVCLLIGGAVAGHFYQPDAQRIEKSIHGNAA